MKVLNLVFTAAGSILILTSVLAEEKCYNKFEYEFHVLEQLILLGQKIQDVRKTIDELDNQLRFSDGQTYIRWGRTTCPDGAVLVYNGSTAGGQSNHTGAPANTLCLSNNPEWDEYIDGWGHGTRIYGAEYFTRASWNRFANLNNHDIPCAVCRVPRGNVLMIPGQKSCHRDYTLQYRGYLMAGAWDDAASTEYICMDREPEQIDSGGSNQTGKRFLLVQGYCGSPLKCPPYVDGRELTCAVCSFSAKERAQSLKPIS